MASATTDIAKGEQYSTPALEEFYRKQRARDQARRALYLKHDREALFVNRNQPHRLPKIGSRNKRQLSPVRLSSGPDSYNRRIVGVDDYEADLSRDINYTKLNPPLSTENNALDYVDKGNDKLFTSEGQSSPDQLMAGFQVYNGARQHKTKPNPRSLYNNHPALIKDRSFTRDNKPDFVDENDKQLSTPQSKSDSPRLVSDVQDFHGKAKIESLGRTDLYTLTPPPAIRPIIKTDEAAEPYKDDISDFGSSVDMQASPKLRLNHINVVAEHNIFADLKDIDKYIPPLSPLNKDYNEPLEGEVDYEASLTPMFSSPLSKDSSSKAQTISDNRAFAGLNKAFEDRMNGLRNTSSTSSEAGGNSATILHPHSQSKTLSPIDKEVENKLDVAQPVAQKQPTVSRDSNVCLHLKNDLNGLTKNTLKSTTSSLQQLSPLRFSPSPFNDEIVYNSEQLATHSSLASQHVLDTPPPKIILNSDPKNNYSSVNAPLQHLSPSKDSPRAIRRLINTAKPARAADDIATIMASNGDDSPCTTTSAKVDARLKHSLAHIQESKQGIEAIESRLSIITGLPHKSNDTINDASSGSNWTTLQIPKLWTKSSTARLGLQFTNFFWILLALFVIANVEDYAWSRYGYMPALSHWEPIDPTRPHWGYATIWVLKRFWRQHVHMPAQIKALYRNETS